MGRPKRTTRTYKDYPGSIRRRGRGWQVRLKLHGTEHPYAVEGTFEDAKEFARREFERLKQRHRRARRGLPGRIRFSTLLQEFREIVLPGLAQGTAEAYEDSLKPIQMYFCGRRGTDGRTLGPYAPVADPWVDDLITADWTKYLSWRRTFRLDEAPPKRRARSVRKVSERTVEKDRAVANRLMKWARRQGYCETNPVVDTDAPQVDSREPVILSDAQFEALLQAAAEARQPMLRTYILALNDLGARSESEVLHLRWEDIDLKDGFVRIVSDRKRRGHTTKGRRSREVPLTPRFRTALAEHQALYRLARYDGKRSEWVFHHTVTRRHHKAGERIKSMRAAFNNAARRAGLPDGFVQHDLRHRRVTTWIAAGKDIAKVQAAVGHADIRTTLGYTHLVREHLRSLVEDSNAPAALLDQMRDLVAQLGRLSQSA